MKILIFDIETGANEKAKSFVKPFDKDNPDHVKYGNAKKEELREEIVKQAYAVYMSQAEEKFALSAITGKILAISYAVIDDETNTEIKYVKTLASGVEEIDLLLEFWGLVKEIVESGGIVVGFNSKKFDIPFIVQRSWILSVPTYPLMEGRWFKPFVVDLYEVWTFGMQSTLYKFISNNLKTVSEVLGLGTKGDEGKKFEKLFYTNPEVAKAYCLNDIDLTLKLYHKLKDFIKVKPKYNERDLEQPVESD